MRDPLFRLISVSSDLPRPRVLREGSLRACLDEMVEIIQHDAISGNAGQVTMTAAYEKVDDSGQTIEVPLATLTTTGNPY